MIFVGIKNPNWEIFKTKSTPIEETHGHIYNAVIGPFKTIRGANFMVRYGQGNPHCQCVNDAERLRKDSSMNIRVEIKKFKIYLDFGRLNILCLKT